jgi:SAM-dependent methyltransferase
MYNVILLTHTNYGYSIHFINGVQIMKNKERKLKAIKLFALIFVSFAAAHAAIEYNEAEAIESFGETFGHELLPGWTGSIGEVGGFEGREINENHRHLIFGGSGSDFRNVDGTFTRFGVGNDTHYTVNTLADENPDLLGDMNSIENFAHLPDERFDTIIASNIPIEYFAPGCFINARRLLRTGGVFIVNNLDGDEHAINACLARFGFVSIRNELDNYRDQLESIGFFVEGEDKQFPFGDPETVWPCIYRKI